MYIGRTPALGDARGAGQHQRNMVGLDLVETHVRGKTLFRNNDGLILLEAQQAKKTLGCLEIAHADRDVIKMVYYQGCIIHARKAFTRRRFCLLGHLDPGQA